PTTRQRTSPSDWRTRNSRAFSSHTAGQSEGLQGKAAVGDERHDEAQHVAHDDGRDLAVLHVHHRQTFGLSRRALLVSAAPGRFRTARISTSTALISAGVEIMVDRAGIILRAVGGSDV